MKKKNLMSVVVSALVLISLLSGCSGGAPGEPERSGEEIIKEGINNLADVTAYTYDFAIKGDVTDELGDNVKFDLNFSGALDSTDEKDPKVDLIAKGTASDAAGAGGSIEAELKVNSEAMYFNVKSLKVEGESDLPAEMTDMFGKWWKMPIPPESVGDVTTSLPSGAGDQNPELKKVFEEATLFNTPKYIGTDTIMGESSVHYSVTVDTKGLLNFLKAAAEAEGETVSVADMAEAEAQLDNVDISGDVWVGVNSKIINQFKGKVTLKGGEGETNGVVNIDVTIGDINKAVTLSLPSGAEEFPIESLLGPMMMMGGGPAMMDVDDSVGMMDEEMSEEDLEALGEMMDAMDEKELDAMMKDLEAMEAL